MSTPEVSWDQPVPTLRTHTDSATLEAQLDASFAAAGVVACGHCGRMTERGGCVPCERQNSPPLFGYVAPRMMILASCRACDERITRIDALLDQNDALAAENSDLARQVVRSKDIAMSWRLRCGRARRRRRPRRRREGRGAMGNIGTAFIYGCLLGFACGLVCAKLSPWPI